MRYSYLMAALAAPVVIAAPSKRQSGNIDTTVLQFALTLEHLENVFYKQALQKFSQDDFNNAGYGPNYYNNIKYIASDEQSHVQFLQTALTAAGTTPNAACTYNFPYTDVNSFITLSSILEGVGTSAYLGGAPLITSKDYLTAAGSILVTEALHTSLQRGAINEVPFASPYGTPLDPTSVYTLAAAFIKECPASNAPLPFVPYPTLTLTTTAGTCEEPDCKPKALAKREWESYGEPATVTVTVTVTKTAGGSWETGYYPGDNKGQGPDYKPDYKPEGKGPDGKDVNNWQSYPDGKGPDGKGPDGKGPDGKGPDGKGPDGKAVDSNQWESYGDDGKPAPPKSTKNDNALNAGDKATFSSASAVPAGSFLTFVSGLSVVSVPATADGNNAVAAIPAEAMGQTYVFLTKTAAANNKLDGSSIVAGPAILEVKPAPPSIDFSQAKH